MNEHREGQVAHQDHARQHRRQIAAQAVVAGIVHAQGLEHAPGAVEDVNGQRHIRHDVDDRHRNGRQRFHDVVVWIAPHVRIAQPPAPRQVGQVEQHVQADDGARPAHGARGVVGGDVVALRCVFLGAADEARALRGQPAALLERVRRMQVHHEHRQQPDPHDPQHQRARQQSAAEIAQRLGVLVHPRRALVEVQVADHVNDHETQQSHAGPGHDPLAADR